MTQILWQRHNKGNDVEALAKMYLTEGATSELNAAGRMNPDQQLGAINAVRAHSTLLAPYMPSAAVSSNGALLPAVANPNPLVPNIGVPGISGAPSVVSGGPGISFIKNSTGRTSGTVESFLASGRVTTAGTQATQNAGPSRIILKPRALEWAFKKYHVQQEWSKEETWQTILEDKWDEFLMSRLMPLMANDLEFSFLHGDEDNVGVSEDDQLLQINDGWLKAMRRLSPKVDYQGSFVDEALWYDMIRKFPALFVPRRKYWFCNPAMPLDWLQVLQARGAGALEASYALGGAGIAPLGTQFWTIPLLKIDEAITTVAAATNAYVRGTSADQFIFLTDAYQFSIDVDGVGPVVVVFPHVGNASKQERSHSVYRVCDLINAALVDEYAANIYRHVARVGQRGQIELVSPTTGAASEITLAAPASSCLGILGLSAGTTMGQAAAAGATNTTYNGTSLFLTMPENLQWRTSVAPLGTGEGGFSQHMKYRQENDTFRYDAWAHHDATIDTPEAIVLAYGLKVARSGENPAA